MTIMSELPTGDNGVDHGLADDLFWLEGKTWGELSDYERQLVIDSQTEQVADEGLYIPNSAVSALIGLLHENGVVDAANIDTEFIRTELGIEHTRTPDKIEICLKRLEEQRLLDALENDRDKQLPILLDDVVSELAVMQREEDYEEQIQCDISFLEFVGVDPRQLLTMHEQGKEKQEGIRNLANDLRSPIAKDIAQYQIKKNKNRPVMRTFQDLYFSVVARKLHEARQKSDFLEGKDAALRKVVDMFKQGSAFKDILASWSRAESIGIQWGRPLVDFVEKNLHIKSDTGGFTDYEYIRSCSSVQDYIARFVGLHYLGRKDLATVPEEVDDRKLRKNMLKAMGISENKEGANTGDLSSVSEKKDKLLGATCKHCGAILRANCNACDNCGTFGGCG